MTTETITITMTDRPPVTVAKVTWPVVAESGDHDHDNQYECQANRTWRWWLRIRQHADGRTLVYGGYHYTTQFQGEENVSVRAGDYYTEPPPYAGALRRIVALIDAQADTDGDGERTTERRWERLVQECVADLAAEPLTDAA